MNFLDRTLQSLSRRCQNVSLAIETIEVRRNVRSIAGKSSLKIPSYTKQSELNTLYKLASFCKPGAYALEMGSHLGASACYIAAGLARNNGHLFCVDTWNNETVPEGEQDTFGFFSNNTRQLNGAITAIRKRSSELNQNELKTPLSFAFIDADHGYEAVRIDFERASQWVHKDGVIAFHDTTSIFPGVPKVIGEALASGDWLLSGYVDSLCWITRVNG
jgi:predicted O-methyltransferase YrrM